MQNECAQQCNIWFPSFDAFLPEDNGEVNPQTARLWWAFFFFLRKRLKKQQRKYGSEWLIQVLSGSFPILLLWLGDAQHSPQQIPDSPFQLRPLNPYCTGGFCTLPSTILHQWGFKVNKLMNFTRSGIGTSQICHSWCYFGQHEEGKEHLYLMSSCCSCF